MEVSKDGGEHTAAASPATLTASAYPGVDPRSIARAGWGVVSGQKLGGGSTITMQLSRLRWGMRTRSPWGKFKQIFRAIQLERHYSKDEIAAAYFTIAPYGGNVEGARAASFRWCGKPASEPRG